MIQLAASLLLIVASSGDHAALHSADANVYLEVPNVPAAAEAYRQAPLVRLLHDEELGAVVRGLAGLPEDFDLCEGLLAQVSALTDPALLPALEALAGIGAELRSASLAVTGLTGSEALALEVQIDPSALMRHVGVQLVLEFEDALSPARLIGMLGLALPPVPAAEDSERIELLGEGRDVQRFSIPGAPYLPTIWAVSADRLLVIGLGAGSPAELGARAAGGPSLLARAEELRGAERFSTPSGATLYESSWWLPSRPFYAELLEAEGPQSLSQIAAATLGAFVPFEPMISRSRIQMREGRFVSESFQRRLEPADEAWRRSLGGAPLSAGVLERAAPDAVWVWATSMSRDGLRGLAGMSIGALQGAAPDTDDALVGAQEPADLAAELAPLLDGFLASFGTDLVVYLLPIAGPKIPLHAVLGLEDAAAFEQGLTGLAKLAEEKAAGMLSVDTRPYKRQPLVTLKPDLASLGVSPMISFDLSVGVVGDRAILGLSAMDVKRQMRRLLGEDAGSHALAQEGKMPKGATSISWLDWGALVGGIYDSARALAALIPDAGMLPIDVTQLPESKVFTRFFQPSTSWSRGGEEGTYTYAESSFGPEVLLGVLAGGAAAGVMQSSRMGAGEMEIEFVDGTEEWSLSGSIPTGPAPAEDAAGKTRQVLQDIKLGIVLHRSDLGSVPERLEDLLKPSAAFPNGYLRRADLPRDGWGQALVYERIDGGQGFTLWSIGPDGVDGRGTGDDIVAP